MQIWTIGHSTLTLDEFIARLRAHGIRQLADIRTIPKSRRHPQFTGEALAAALSSHGIAYRHFAGLGGLRRPRADSVNTAWQHPGFRGYADYMEQPAFAQAFAELLSWADQAPTAVMCAEARWWQCHRRLLADALLVGGHDVRHIMGAGPARLHELSPFARVRDGRITYPGLV